MPDSPGPPAVMLVYFFYMQIILELTRIEKEVLRIFTQEVPAEGNVDGASRGVFIVQGNSQVGALDVCIVAVGPVKLWGGYNIVKRDSWGGAVFARL